MAQTIKHVKVSAVPDGGDTNQVQPSDWNANHAITGTVDYSEVTGKPSTFPPTLPILESDVTNLVSDLALKSPLASPTFTGDPKAPTPATADNDTSIATTAHVHAAVAADVVRASTTEVLTGTDTAKVVTPDALAALWRKGTPVAAAPTLVLGDGGVFVISSGTGPITDIDFGTASRDGRWAWLVFNTVVTLTHSVNLNLVGAADITTASQDMALIVQEAGDAVRMLDYVRANGGVLGSALASTTDVLTGTDAAKAVTPNALAALWESAGVTAAATMVIGEGAYFLISGAATITAFSWTIQHNGRGAWFYCGGVNTLTHSVALKVPGAVNFVTANGDRFYAVSENATDTRIMVIQRADGSYFGLSNVDNTSDANKPVSTAQQTALNLKADLASPTFTGDPKAPTPATADNDTSIATTAMVHAAVAADIVAPLALKADLAGPSFSGLVTVGGGQIAFPATQNASAGANTLDDYEEGAFTPTLTFGGAAVGMTLAAQAGRYTKIGNCVNFLVRFQLTAKGTSTGVAVIGALPFTVIATYFSVSILATQMTSGVGDTFLSGYVVASTATVNLYKQATGNVVALTDADFLNTTQLYVAGWYQV